MKNLSDHIYDLIENSISATASLIKVELSIGEDSILKCTIEDNGIGISAVDLRKVSHPFFTSRKTRNQGLGLALLEQNSQAAGGKIDLESELNKGTILKFSWDLKNIDCLPCGDLTEIFLTLMRVCPDIRFEFLLLSNTEKTSWSSTEIINSIYPLSLCDSDIRDGVKEYLENTSIAFNQEWNKNILSTINSEIKL